MNLLKVKQTGDLKQLKKIMGDLHVPCPNPHRTLKIYLLKESKISSWVRVYSKNKCMRLITL